MAYASFSNSHVPLLVLGWGLSNLTDRSYPSHDGNSGMVPKEKKNDVFMDDQPCHVDFSAEKK